MLEQAPEVRGKACAVVRCCAYHPMDRISHISKGQVRLVMRNIPKDFKDRNTGWLATLSCLVVRNGKGQKRCDDATQLLNGIHYWFHGLYLALKH